MGDWNSEGAAGVRRGSGRDTPSENSQTRAGARVTCCAWTGSPHPGRLPPDPQSEGQGTVARFGRGGRDGADSPGPDTGFGGVPTPGAGALPGGERGSTRHICVVFRLWSRLTRCLCQRQVTAGDSPRAARPVSLLADAEPGAS